MCALLMLIACSGEPEPAPVAAPPPAEPTPALEEALEPVEEVDSGRQPIGFVGDDGEVVDELPEPEVEAPPPEPTPDEHRSSAKETLAGLAIVIERGDKLHRVRIGDPRACRAESARAQSELAELRTKTEALPDGLQRYVVAVVNDLDICVQCDDTAMLMCQVSRDTMSTARRAVEAWQPE